MPLFWQRSAFGPVGAVTLQGPAFITPSTTVSKVLEVVGELRKAMGHLHPGYGAAEELATAADQGAILTAIKEAEGGA